MSRGVRKSSYNIMKNRGSIILSIFLLSKEISEIFLGGIFFLTRWGGLSILKLIMSNAVKYHSVYMEFLSLKFSWRRTAVCFKFLYFVDETCILQNQKRGSERSFWGNFWENSPQIYLIIITKWPKTTSPPPPPPHFNKFWW